MGLMAGSVAFGIHGIPLKAFSSPLLLNMEQTNGKILVLLQLNGGNDGLNTVIPFEDALYYNRRPHIGIKKEEVVKLTDLTGLNPAMAPFRDLFDKGKLDIVQGVGYENHNRSHFRSTDIWMSSSDANQHIHDGWVGRYLNHAYPDYPTILSGHPMAVQLGSVESMLLQSPLGSMSVVFENPSQFYQLLSGNVMDKDAPAATIAGAELAYLKQISSQSTIYASSIKKAAEKSKSSVTYPQTNIGRQLAIVASLISGGLNTPIYLTNHGGFDTHVNQLTAHANLLQQLTEAIAAFQTDIERKGVADNVVLMTFSEFGRRVAENGSLGTDHGTSAPLFLVGKKVAGGIIGKNPSLVTLDRHGDLLHQYDYRQIYSSVLQNHLGISAENTQLILGKEYETLNLFKTPEDNRSYSPLKLMRVFPNPMKESATFEVELKRTMDVRISLFDMSGREVMFVTEGTLNAGTYSHIFINTTLKPGIYTLRLAGENFTSAKKLVIT